MHQANSQNNKFTNSSFLNNDVQNNNKHFQNSPALQPQHLKISKIEKSLKEAKKNLKLKHYLKANNQLVRIFKQQKTIEIALLISDCYIGMKNFKEAVQFFETHLPHFKNNGKYWGILALHNFALEDFEGAAGASLKAIDEHGVMLTELWKIFVHSSKRLRRTDVLYTVCKKYLNKFYGKSFDTLLENPYLVDGFLASCYDTDRIEGWKFSQDYLITVSNVDKFGEVSGVIAALIASLIPDNTKNNKLKLLWNTKAKELDPDNFLVKWNLAQSQLSEGLIKEGVENYEYRFAWEEFPSYIREFKKPRWQPDVPSGAKIMIWFEQGIGDQIRFFSTINLFKQKFPNLIIETSEKTYPILKAAFTDIEVRVSTMEPDLTTKIEDFDYHLPSASMFYHIVAENAEKFKEEEFYLLERYLIPDQQRKEYWHRKLQLVSNKPKVGICWTSQNNSGLRGRHYTTLEKWRGLLDMPDFDFVSLQYQLDMDELRSLGDISENFIDTGFLDQKEDLEGATALISNLDFVISTAAAPSMLSSCLGIPTIIYSTYDNTAWLGRKHKFNQHPYFKNTLIYPTENAESDEDIVPDIINFLTNKYK